MTDASDLAQKRCVPCDGGVPELSPPQVEAYLRQVPAWTLKDGGKMIRREWRLKDFAACLQLLQRIAEVAEAEGHHPDLHLVGYRNLIVELTTHAIDGLSESDFILAAKIDRAAD